MIEQVSPFFVPIFKYKPENSDKLCSLLIKEANSLEKLDENGGLLSESWEKGEKAKNKKDYKKNGYTSFYTKNIFEISNFFDLHSAAINAFYNVSSNLVEEPQGFLDHAWVSTYNSENYVPRHIHPNSHLSCVFYGDSDNNSGEIIFHNPLYEQYAMLYEKKINLFADQIKLKAEKGCFYIFPSFVPHETRKHMGENKRIIYSANYIFTKSRLGKNMWHTIKE